MSDEEFKKAMQGVKPLKKSNKITIKKKLAEKPIQIYSPKKEPEFDIHFSETIRGDSPLFYSVAGIRPNLIKKLKQGLIPIDATLDLHHHRVASAEQQLIDFFQEALTNHARCLLIIHGKGFRSNNPNPILKNLVYHFLKNHPAVNVFCSAIPRDGGVGATYVYLKSSPR